MGSRSKEARRADGTAASAKATKGNAHSGRSGTRKTIVKSLDVSLHLLRCLKGFNMW